jgi:hypothetical protein
MEAPMRRDERVIGAWHYEIQYGPEGEANYAWLYRGAEMVATMKTHHAAALTAALEAGQPAATGWDLVNGLENGTIALDDDMKPYRVTASPACSEQPETFTRAQMLAEVDRRVERALAARSVIVGVPVEPDFWTSRNNFENMLGKGVTDEKDGVVWDFATQEWVNADVPLYATPPSTRIAGRAEQDGSAITTGGAHPGGDHDT